jgi:non-specific serine/threonine protein kinase
MAEAEFAGKPGSGFAASLGPPVGRDAEIAAIRAAHADWCIALAETANRHMEQPDLDDWWPRLAADHDDLRLAFDWLEATGDGPALLRLAAALWCFWYHDGYPIEGGERLRRALAMAGQAPPPAAREAAIGAALLAHTRGDDDEAVRYCEMAFAYGAGDCPRDAGRVRYVRGLIAEDAGRFADAEDAFAAARTAFVAAADEFWLGAVLLHLGIAAFGCGDLARARAALDEALSWQRARGYGWQTARALLVRAQVALSAGEAGEARPILADALRLAAAQGTPRSLVHETIATVAAYAVIAGRPVEAARLAAWAESDRVLAGSPARLPERALYEQTERRVRRALGPAAFARARATGKAQGWDEVFASAQALTASGTAHCPGDPVTRAGLTPRETEVLHLLARRLTDKEIAAALELSPRTVMHHVSNLLGKLALPTRRAAAAWAADHLT